MSVPPKALLEWLKLERDYCFNATPYGRTLLEDWLPTTGRLADELAKFGSESGRPGSEQYVVDSMDTEYGLPGYQGVIARCLTLAQRADSENNGSLIENVLATTLATNDRYAAVYTPHVAPEWNVIAFDWGIISGLWGLAVIFSKMLESSGVRGSDQIVALCLDEERMAEAIGNAPNVEAELAQAVLPCILMGAEPPIPLTYEDDFRYGGVVEAMFNALVFSVVAHEYAHLWLGHPFAQEPDRAKRHQMEHEADTLALAYILSNPWRDVFEDDDPLPLILGSGAQSLSLSFIRMLETGDRIVSDVVSPRGSFETHPSGFDRLVETERMLQSHFPLEKDEIESLSASRQTLGRFADHAWNRALDTVIETVGRQADLPSKAKPTRLRKAELKFL